MQGLNFPDRVHIQGLNPGQAPINPVTAPTYNGRQQNTASTLQAALPDCFGHIIVHQRLKLLYF